MIFTSWWFEFVKHVLGSSIYSRFLPKKREPQACAKFGLLHQTKKSTEKNNKKQQRGAKANPWQVDLGVNWACTTAEPFLRVLEDERFPFFGWDLSRWNLVMKVHPWDMYLCVCVPWKLFYVYNVDTYANMYTYLYIYTVYVCIPFSICIILPWHYIYLLNWISMYVIHYILKRPEIAKRHC